MRQGWHSGQLQVPGVGGTDSESPERSCEQVVISWWPADLQSQGAKQTLVLNVVERPSKERTGKCPK